MKEMHPKVIFIFLCFVTELASSEIKSSELVSNGNKYVGAVVEYHRLGDFKKSSLENLMDNILQYTYFIGNATKRQVDIIVFPELGLQPETTKEFIPVPDPVDKISPFTDNSQHQALQDLSKAAHDAKIYVVVNLLEEASSKGGPQLRYNTDVVFDRSGIIIQRYRKYNLFNEHGLNITGKPEFAYFDTDFGARFGLFTCFDIMFSTPALDLVSKYNITDAAFPSAWLSELPFLTSIQMQFSWSFATNVNLLASGLNNPKIYHSGSGIYRGKQGSLSSLLSENILSVALTPNESSGVWSTSNTKKEGISFLRDELRVYKTVLIEPEPKNCTAHHVTADLLIRDYLYEETLCNRDVCCYFNLQLQMTFGPVAELNRSTISGDDFHLFRYRLVAFDGVRDFGGAATGGVQVCGVIPCLGDSLDSCAFRADAKHYPQLVIPDPERGQIQLYNTTFTSIKITASGLNTNGSFTMPNVLVSSNPGYPTVRSHFGKFPSHEDVSFTKSGSNATLKLEKKSEPTLLGTCAIYNRVFSRDGQASTPVPNWSMNLTPSLISITLLLLIYQQFAGTYFGSS